MPITGKDFENLVQPFFKVFFGLMNFVVIQVRNQTSGTQDGFDIAVLFFDDNLKKREFYIECKYYTSSKLDWSEIFNKQIQIDGSNFNVDAFILLSPLRDLSNIDYNLQNNAIKYFKFPVEFWTPDKDIEHIFTLDDNIYNKIFDNKVCTIVVDKDEVINKYRLIINSLIQKKDMLKCVDKIRINDTFKEPIENENLRTNLDEKLNSVLSETDEQRIEYHRTRANYKVYLEELSDLNPDLRSNILAWESDLKLKASRLTNKFKIDETYTPEKFFHEFFEAAELEMLTFYKDLKLSGDRHKLLHGVVFELAAQCPLDWRRDG